MTKILLAEDDDSLRTFLSAALRRAGVTAASARCAEDVEQSDAVVVPGVGSFDSGARAIIDARPFDRCAVRAPEIPISSRKVVTSKDRISSTRCPENSLVKMEINPETIMASDSARMVSRPPDSGVVISQTWEAQPRTRVSSMRS